MRLRAHALGLLAVLLVGCTGNSAGTNAGAGQPRPATASGDGSKPVVLEEVTGSAEEDVPSALKRMDDPALPTPLVDPAEVRSGGPPPDGIPPIDHPSFVPAGKVDWLAPDEPVLAPAIGAVPRAYPVRIMIWHEIVNDVVENRPVAVTYCPLCNSALAFDRRVGDRLLTFGTSGSLYRSDLVMYDRQTESLWSQIEGRAIAGMLAGTKLDRVPVQTLTWAQWRAANPGGWVLSRHTGAARDYGRNPYGGYDDLGSSPFLFNGPIDPRLPAMQRVAGLGEGNSAVAVALPRLVKAGVAELMVAGRPVVLWALPELTSALDSTNVAEGRAVGGTAAFDPELGGRRLTFIRTGGSFVDEQTGSRWNVQGQAIDGPLAGAELQPVEHLDTFWFAWAAFHPNTAIVELP